MQSIAYETGYSDGIEAGRESGKKQFARDVLKELRKISVDPEFQFDGKDYLLVKAVMDEVMKDGK